MTVKNKDVFSLSFGDTHSGGLTALFPDYTMQFHYDAGNILTHSPSPMQLRIFNHFVDTAKKVKELSKGMRKVVVMNGDAIDGNHHGTVQIVTPNPKHQMQIHVDLMETFLKESGFSIKNGDELHYVSGTESHTAWNEYDIATTFMSAYNADYSDELKLEIHGKRIWWIHQAAKPGKGPNEGNGIRNWGKDLYFDCLKEKRDPPHMVNMSHFHKSVYDSFNDSYRHTIHLQVLPSWQHKTRYGVRASPGQRNDIGAVYNIIRASGDIEIRPPLLMEQ